jgi:hypothetical protein
MSQFCALYRPITSFLSFDTCFCGEVFSQFNLEILTAMSYKETLTHFVAARVAQLEGQISKVLRHKEVNGLWREIILDRWPYMKR